MIARVVMDFHDARANVLRRAGEEFEVTPERLAELARKLPSYVSAAEPEAPLPEDDGLDSKPTAELREMAAERGIKLPSRASREKVIAALRG